MCAPSSDPAPAAVPSPAPAAPAAPAAAPAPALTSPPVAAQPAPQAVAPAPVPAPAPTAPEPQPAALTAAQIEEQIAQRAQERVAVIELTRPLIDDAQFNFQTASPDDMLRAALGTEYVQGSNTDRMFGHVQAIASARTAAEAQGGSPPSPTRDPAGRYQQPAVAPYGMDPAHPGFKDRSSAFQFHVQEMSKSPREHRFERRAEAAGNPITRQTA